MCRECSVDLRACVKYRTHTYETPTRLSNASGVMIEIRKIHFIVVGPTADTLIEDKKPRRSIEAWREKAAQEGWALHVHLNKEVEELIDGHYPHYRATYDRLMAYKPVAAADFAR
jgi:hypothetical protein